MDTDNRRLLDLTIIELDRVFDAAINRIPVINRIPREPPNEIDSEGVESFLPPPQLLKKFCTCGCGLMLSLPTFDAAIKAWETWKNSPPPPHIPEKFSGDD
jgi:hypothetical protein